MKKKKIPFQFKCLKHIKKEYYSFLGMLNTKTSIGIRPITKQLGQALVLTQMLIYPL